MADVDVLLAKAPGCLGLKVILDLLPNHTSGRHERFKANRAVWLLKSEEWAAPSRADGRSRRFRWNLPSVSRPGVTCRHP
ncbi:alpha-amylase family glycosyl hydrolase [Arthrobacter sp. R-11]|uniref:alpha-amylase family glycosyl hydrolase n=1 Tax=Arthrobacter sp. R-11 TaxID=3404053 RepID=UPI003CE9F0FC